MRRPRRRYSTERRRNGMDGAERKPLRVAVIDDDPELVKVLRVIMTINGIEVLEAYSGMGGYMMVRNELPDVVLLDIMMPDVDGFEICRKLRLDEATAHIPIIFVSAKTGQEHVERGLSLGAQGYITKPFNPKVLLAKIMEVAGIEQKQ